MTGQKSDQTTSTRNRKLQGEIKEEMHRNIAVQPSKGSQNIAAKVGNIPDKASRNKPDKVARNIPVRVARGTPDKVLTQMQAKEIGNKPTKVAGKNQNFLPSIKARMPQPLTRQTPAQHNRKSKALTTIKELSGQKNINENLSLKFDEGAHLDKVIEKPRRPLSKGRRTSTGSTNSSSSSSSSPDAAEAKMTPNPDQNDEDILSKIGNRQTKVVNQSKEKCCACSKPLTEAGFLAGGQLYHAACFRCKYCSSNLGQTFFVRENHPCCEACHREMAEDCWVCKTKILEDLVECKDKFYHPGCMKCFVCEEQLTDKYFTFEDRPVCENDLKALLHVCSVCDGIVKDKVYMLDGHYFCEKDFKALSSTETCSTCAKPISPGTSLSVGDVKFHPACLVCEVCHKNMEGKQITLDDKNKVYCTQDYARKFSPKCSGCKKSIVPKKGQTKTQRIRAMGKDFHLSCFKCKCCHLVLDSGVKGRECWPRGQVLMCYR